VTSVHRKEAGVVAVAGVVAYVATFSSPVPFDVYASQRPSREIEGVWSANCGVATRLPLGHASRIDRVVVSCCAMDDTTVRAHAPSGRFVLRVSPELHGILRRSAARAGLSLNDYCVRKLMAPGAIETPVLEVVERATAQFGEDLVGIVVFGSWARDELTERSDVDLFVVVDPSVRIVRSLYRVWDEFPTTWEGRPVEVHIVNPPEPEETPSGLWAEAALEGLVLFERGLEVSRRMIEVRKRIAGGEISRRRAHGQSYWVIET
jgi:predicted nucleotidyltransferase